LRILESAHQALDERARHHHIYGLIHSVCDRQSEARRELQTALNAEGDTETKARIQQALDILDRASPS
jgi:hypothetical protein